MKRLLAAAVLLILAGCDSDGPTPPVSPFADILEQAQTRRAAWEQRGIDDYTFEFERICFCPPLYATVTVVNGAVTSAIDMDTGMPVDAELLDEVRTIPELFDFIEEAAALDPDALTVEYDLTESFPTRISMDRLFMAADDEITLQAGALMITRSAGP